MHDELSKDLLYLAETVETVMRRMSMDSPLDQISFGRLGKVTLRLRDIVAERERLDARQSKEEGAA